MYSFIKTTQYQLQIFICITQLSLQLLNSTFSAALNSASGKSPNIQHFQNHGMTFIFLALNLLLELLLLQWIYTTVIIVVVAV
jgi:hypothetical protein